MSREGAVATATIDAGGRAAAPVRLTLLGGFGLTSGDAAVDLPHGTQRLVAFLAIQDRPLLRSYVAGALWLDASEQRSHASLRSALWRARRPGCRIVDADETHVGIADNVEVDVRDMVDCSQGLLHDEIGAEAADERALADDLLPDWYEDWVVIERERLRQLRLHALEAIAARHLAAARYGRAVEAALAAVRGEPLRESAQRLLVTIYLAEANVAEAHAAYRRYEALLADSLGIPPSPGFRRLLEEAVTAR